MSRALTGLTLLLLAIPVFAGAELRLKGGDVLEGTSVERKGDYYLLRVAEGEVWTIPIEMVVEMKLTGDDAMDATGFKPARGETIVGPEDGPDLPETAEQLEVIGEPARFQPGVIDSTWRPESDWPDGDPGNEFSPVRWYRPPIEPHWTPRSAFKQNEDVSQFDPVRWYRPPIDPEWRPRDGFGPTVWFESVIRSGK